MEIKNSQGLQRRRPSPWKKPCRNLPELMTVKEISKALKVSSQKVYRLIEKRKLKAVSVGAGSRPVYRIFKTSFIQYLHSE